MTKRYRPVRTSNGRLYSPYVDAFGRIVIERDSNSAIGMNLNNLVGSAISRLHLAGEGEDIALHDLLIYMKVMRNALGIGIEEALIDQ
eukprot:CAMPEP_0168736654 /NCGR_PEP_ID=MMETSP0724-20121128/9972_1 /TAXON_ID=265536 /ORGANISM="Amphiprora sp., Strain CCMP467" /LENGTH=87 /DNA_ID=CAMNT_0008783859 /DNA_START=1271 /DNA_END=1531 /DNA_ORIENTATION=+